MNSLGRYAIAALVLGVAGCASKSETPAPADYEGFWTIQSMTVAGPTRGAMTVDRYTGRDPAGPSVRGDLRVTVVGDGVRISGRLALLTDGLPGNAPIQVIDYPVKLDGTIWLLESTDGISAFESSLAGDFLTLYARPEDPRNTTHNQPWRIVLARVPEWTSVTVGNWQVESMTFTWGAASTWGTGDRRSRSSTSRSTTAGS